MKLIHRLAPVFFLLPLTLPAQSDSLVVQQILERYTEAYERARDIDSLTSVSYEGTVEQGGRTYEFVLRKKRPDSIRYRIFSEESSVICGFNGRTAWKQVEVGGSASSGILSGEERETLRAEANFESPLFRHLEKPGVRVELKGNAVVEGENTYILLVYKNGEPAARYYLDAQSSYVRRRDTLGAEGEAGLETLYRDYREVDGFPFAFEIENRVRGERQSLTRIAAVEVNPGLLSFYFEPPQD